MKKKVYEILSMCIIFMLMIGIIPFRVQAATGKVSLSVSSKSVNIGDTITLTVTGSADEASLMHMNIKCEGGAEYIGEGIPAAIFDIDAGGTATTKLQYKATSPGTVTFRTEKVEAYTTANEENLSYNEDSISVTVKNAVTEEPGTPGTTTPTKSSDNSLKSLTISPGTLSPKFKYSTMKYKATVASDVTSVAVDAQVSNEKATVESVTGNTNLKVGENTIKITVKAENGTTAVYTITVTRSAEITENPGETSNTPAEEPDDMTTIIDGISYKVSETLPEQTFPEEFTRTTTSYDGKEVEAYSFSFEELLVLYLTPAEDGAASGAFHFYNSEKEQFFPYINITVGKSYMLVLPISYYTGDVPEGFQEEEVTIADFAVEGWRCTVETTEELTKAKKNAGFYLIYGVNKDGTPGMYQYDADDLSVQRFNEAACTTGAAKEVSRYSESYNEILEKYNKEKSRDRIIMAALLLALVVAIIAIINILIFGRKGKNGEDEEVDYIDIDDL